MQLRALADCDHAAPISAAAPRQTLAIVLADRFVNFITIVPG